MRVFYVAYEVDTSGNGQTLLGIMQQRFTAQYINSCSPLDYFERLSDHFVGVVMSALGRLSAATGPGDLVIMAAPEFYFKNKSGTFFDNATMTNGLVYLTKNLPSPSNGSTLLILPGTIWWGYPDKNVPGKSYVFNTLPVFVNNALAHTWQKQALSGIDGLQNCDVWDNDSKTSAGRLDREGGLQAPVFSFNVGARTVTLGLEVCLDHSYCAMEEEDGGTLRTLNAVVDIHLLISCGMNVIPESVAARQGGIMLRCDGLGVAYGGQAERPDSDFRSATAAPVEDWSNLTANQPSAYFESWGGGDPNNPQDHVDAYKDPIVI